MLGKLYLFSDPSGVFATDVGEAHVIVPREVHVKDILELGYGQSVVSLINLGDNVMKPGGDEVPWIWFVQLVARGKKRDAVLLGDIGPLEHNGHEVF